MRTATRPLGIRMQLWHASWLMFLDHPVIGTGARNFRANLAELRDRGIVTPLVASDYGEPHNDLIAAMARLWRGGPARHAVPVSLARRGVLSPAVFAGSRYPGGSPRSVCLFACRLYGDLSLTEA